MLFSLSFTAEAALWLIFNSGARSLKRKWAISINAFKTLVYPFQVIDLESLFHPIQTHSLKSATCTRERLVLKRCAVK